MTRKQWGAVAAIAFLLGLYLVIGVFNGWWA